MVFHINKSFIGKKKILNNNVILFQNQNTAIGRQIQRMRTEAQLLKRELFAMVVAAHNGSSDNVEELMQVIHIVGLLYTIDSYLFHST